MNSTTPDEYQCASLAFSSFGFVILYLFFGATWIPIMGFHDSNCPLTLYLNLCRGTNTWDLLLQLLDTTFRITSSVSAYRSLLTFHVPIRFDGTNSSDKVFRQNHETRDRVVWFHVNPSKRSVFSFNSTSSCAVEDLNDVIEATRSV